MELSTAKLVDFNCKWEVVMTKIYIDTNWFIDFYREAQPKMNWLDDLSKEKDSLVITRQTINEFHRNRVATLKNVFNAFTNTVKVPSPHITALLRMLAGYEELESINKNYKKKSKEVLDNLLQVIEDEKKDPVAQKLFAIWDDAAVTKLEPLDELVDKAYRRKLLGTPPTSPNKKTVGDELIWELLLANMKEDLIVVTGDLTFLENKALLQGEFSSKTGKTLRLITEEFSSALKAAGKTPSDKLINVEKQIAAKKNLPADFMWRTKGSGKHAASLYNRFWDILIAYQTEIEKTGDDISDDSRVIPVLRLFAARIQSHCDEVDSLIRDELGEDSEGENDVSKR